MKFKPFGKKYEFAKDALVKNFPDFMHQPIGNWLWKILYSAHVVDMSSGYGGRGRYLKSDFHNQLQVAFREVFSERWNEVLPFVLGDLDRTANFLALCLQNFANAYDATELEYILSQGGSGYEVTKTQKNASEYETGVYDLIERVNEIVKEQSAQALNENDLLREAWIYCYSRNPDYEKVVSRCCDFLEQFLGKLYFPNDSKPQLKKFIHAFEQNSAILQYKGDSIVNPKSTLTSLLVEASNIRGQHTGGQGRKPTKEETEFILHTTIYIWNLHQK